MIRIRGVVKAAKTAKDWLKVGIETTEVEAFQSFVQNTLETIEQLCEQNGITPYQLPARSRNAYQSLKEIDFQALPTIERSLLPEQPTVVTQKSPLYLSNLRSQQKELLEYMGELTRSGVPKAKQRATLQAQIQRNIDEVDRICEKRYRTPSDLAPASRKIYAWLQFLSDDRRLKQHLQATHQAQKIAANLNQNSAKPLKSTAITFVNMSGTYRGRRSRQTAWLNLNEGLIAARPNILKRIIAIALFSSKKDNQPIREFINSTAYQDILLALDAIADVAAEQPQGNTYDLERLFAEINQEYFDNAMEQPRLSWSGTYTYRKFGHYESARDQVVLSKTLDDPQVPEFVVAYVLYHELLHKQHGHIWKNGKQYVHTQAFKRDEEQFEQAEAAEAWLAKFAYLARRKK